MKPSPATTTRKASVKGVGATTSAVTSVASARGRAQIAENGDDPPAAEPRRTSDASQASVRKPNSVSTLGSSVEIKAGVRREAARPRPASACPCSSDSASVAKDTAAMATKARPGPMKPIDAMSGIGSAQQSDRTRRRQNAWNEPGGRHGRHGAPPARRDASARESASSAPEKRCGLQGPRPSHPAKSPMRSAAARSRPPERDEAEEDWPESSAGRARAARHRSTP